MLRRSLSHSQPTTTKSLRAVQQVRTYHHQGGRFSAPRAVHTVSRTTGTVHQAQTTQQQPRQQFQYHQQQSAPNKPPELSWQEEQQRQRRVEAKKRVQSSAKFMPPPPSLKFAKKTTASKPPAAAENRVEEGAVPPPPAHPSKPMPQRQSDSPPENATQFSHKSEVNKEGDLSAPPPPPSPETMKVHSQATSSPSVPPVSDPIQFSAEPTGPPKRKVVVARHADDIVRLMRRLFKPQPKEWERAQQESGVGSFENALAAAGNGDSPGIIGKLVLPSVTLHSIQNDPEWSRPIVLGLLGERNAACGGPDADISVYGPARDKFISTLKSTSVFGVVERTARVQGGPQGDMPSLGQEDTATFIRVRGGIREIAAKVEHYLITCGGRKKHVLQQLMRQVLSAQERQFVITSMGGSIHRILLLFPSVFELSESMHEVTYKPPFLEDKEAELKKADSEFEGGAEIDTFSSRGYGNAAQRLTITSEYLDEAKRARAEMGVGGQASYQLPHLEKYIPVEDWVDVEAVKTKYFDDFKHNYHLMKRHRSAPFTKFLLATKVPVGWEVVVNGESKSYQFVSMRRTLTASAAADPPHTLQNQYPLTDMADVNLAKAVAQYLPIGEWVKAESVLLRYPLVPEIYRNFLQKSLAPLCFVYGPTSHTNVRTGGVSLMATDRSSHLTRAEEREQSEVLFDRAEKVVDLRGRHGNVPELISFVHPTPPCGVLMTIASTLMHVAENQELAIGDSTVVLPLLQSSLPLATRLAIRDRYGGLRHVLQSNPDLFEVDLRQAPPTVDLNPYSVFAEFGEENEAAVLGTGRSDAPPTSASAIDAVLDGEAVDEEHSPFFFGLTDKQELMNTWHPTTSLRKNDKDNTVRDDQQMNSGNRRAGWLLPQLLRWRSMTLEEEVLGLLQEGRDSVQEKEKKTDSVQQLPSTEAPISEQEAFGNLAISRFDRSSKEATLPFAKDGCVVVTHKVWSEMELSGSMSLCLDPCGSLNI